MFVKLEACRNSLSLRWIFKRWLAASPGGRPLGVDQAAVVASMFKALGDPVRLRLMSMVASVPEMCVCDLIPAFDLSGPTICR